MPAIAQSKETGEVLMLAWMTRGTLEETLATRPCHLLVALARQAVAQG